MHRGCWNWKFEYIRVSSPGIPRGGGAKNSDLLTSKVQKTSLLYTCAEQTEP